MKKIQDLLSGCLYFNINIFSRQLSRMADEAFSSVGISAPHASLMLLVYDNPGISPTKLSRLLSLSPSTITRFIDALVKKNLLKRRVKGKSTMVYTTPLGDDVKKEIAVAWINLVERYSARIGSPMTQVLCQQVLSANENLQTDH